MSLDVYLLDEEVEVDCKCCECGNKHKINTKPILYENNITHNLEKMAEEAGIYQEIWRSDEIGITKAAQLIDPLTKGLELLRKDKSRFQKFNPKNGWGNYSILVDFVKDYLNACVANPGAEVSVSR